MLVAVGYLFTGITTLATIVLCYLAGLCLSILLLLGYSPLARRFPIMLCILALIMVPASLAENPKYPVPRFVSIKFDEVNVRTGPAKDCPIEWVFIKKGEPVEIVAEYEDWRKIRDINGEGGWAHSSVLSGHRFVVISAKNTLPLLASIANYESIVAKVSPGLRCALKKCKKDWCQIECKSYRGWLPKRHLWGIYPED